MKNETLSYIKLNDSYKFMKITLNCSYSVVKFIIFYTLSLCDGIYYVFLQNLWGALIIKRCSLNLKKEQFCLVFNILNIIKKYL